jgi:hypothetical protein
MLTGCEPRRRRPNNRLLGICIEQVDDFDDIGPRSKSGWRECSSTAAGDLDFNTVRTAPELPSHPRWGGAFAKETAVVGRGV